ncbi:MAG TPA: DNA polymerase III subunit gamma/tau [Patescibacteria group bacterium]|nr:DNA polymerase III subunit gamma/tau [Patescibacteria group bacterium]
MVYYRKYRPQTISELDLPSVRERLSAILSAKELPHAFLFTGPKGLGKTSSARILAKAINCEERQLTSDKSHVTAESNVKGQMSNVEPCNHCDACISITNGSNIDVLEIDAASNRGIDEIRDLREKIKFAPASLPKKVYIIDEVHMLTTDAFNALLKTLEEPPAHAVFILCTTELEKVPATIVSRTFQVQFKKPGTAEIVASLGRIVVGEKLDVESGVLEEIARLADGAFRDAAKLLEDLVIANGSGKVTKEKLAETFRTAGLDTEVVELLKSLAKKDIKVSLKSVENLVVSGVDFKSFTERLAKSIHDLLMNRAGVKVEGAQDIAELNTGDARQLLDMINKSYADIKFSVLPQIPLELVVVDWCIGNEANSLPSAVHSQSQSATPPSPTANTQPLTPNPQTPTPQSAAVKNVIATEQTKSKEAISTHSSSAPIASQHPTPNPQHPTPNTQLLPPNSQMPSGDMFRENAKLDDFFAAYLVRLKVENHSIAGILRGCKIVSIGDGQIVFETRFKFHKDKLNEAKTSSILDARATDLLKETMHVVVNLIEK